MNESTGDGCRQLVFHANGAVCGSSDVTRADTITLMLYSPYSGADVTSQHLQTTLSGSVCRYSLTTQFGHHGADVDDLYRDPSSSLQAEQPLKR